jgi:hypothetical protein
MTEVPKKKVMQASAPCETCPVHNAANLKKLGVNMEEWDFVQHGKEHGV